MTIWAAVVAGSPATPVDAPERSFPGARSCGTGELLEAGARLDDGRTHDGGRLALGVLLEAASCDRLSGTDSLRLVDVRVMADHGVAWLAEHERGAEALEHALDVWELAADQRGAGAWTNVSSWQQVGRAASEVVERSLAESLPIEVRTAARARLLSIADDLLELDAVRRADQIEWWSIVFWSAPTWIAELDWPRRPPSDADYAREVFRDDELLRARAGELGGGNEIGDAEGCRYRGAR
jgi:hypothetical protein